jgi:fatty acid desaturase
MDPADWARLPWAVRVLHRCNNTLLGRMVLGPLIGNWEWARGEVALIRADHGMVRRDWALHLLGLVPVVAWLWWAAMPWWAYLLATWIGHGLLKVRTFLEHRAHELARARTVIVEDKGPLALLFLNNNYHAVHHMHPGVYLANRDHYVRHNDGYVYTSYWPIFRDFLLRAKDPVPHPLMDQTSLRNVGMSPELSKNGTPG